MMDLFKSYQPELVKLANLDAGRKLLGIDHEVKSREWISRIFPNGYSVRTGRRKYRSVFRSYPLFGKKLQAVVSQVEITRNEKLYQKLGKYKGLLHYSGLFRQPRVFPQIFLTESTFFSGAGDGRCYYSANDGTSQTAWDATRDNATGTVQDDISSVFFGIGGKVDGNKYWYIYRGYFPFVTSDIPDEDTVSAATLNAYITANANDWNDAKDYFTVCQTTQASTAELAVGDYDSVIFTSGSNNIDMGNIGTAAYKAWTLDETGLGWVTKDGNTLLSLIEGHDYEDVKPSDAPSSSVIYNALTASTSEETATSQDPKLIVTHAVPVVAGGSPMQFGGGVVVA